MTKRTWMGVVAGLAVLLVAGGLFASNMGFKLNYVMDGKNTAGSQSGTNTIALPYNQQTNLLTASNLKADIEAAAIPGAVTSVQKFLRTGDSLLSYAGLDPLNDFTLTPGEGYRVQLNTTVAGVNYVIVGSHDPAKVVELDGKNTNGSQSGTNSFAYPYHSTAATASDLRDEINAAAGVAGAVTSVQKFIRTGDSLLSYAGLDPLNDFPLAPGEAYRVQLNTTVTGVSYVPSHY